MGFKHLYYKTAKITGAKDLERKTRWELLLPTSLPLYHLARGNVCSILASLFIRSCWLYGRYLGIAVPGHVYFGSSPSLQAGPQTDGRHHSVAS